MASEIEKTAENAENPSQRPRRMIKKPSRYDDEEEPCIKKKKILHEVSTEKEEVSKQKSEQPSSYLDEEEEQKVVKSTKKSIKKDTKSKSNKKAMTVNRMRNKFQPIANAESNCVLMDLSNKFGQDRKSASPSTTKVISTPPSSSNQNQPKLSVSCQQEKIVVDKCVASTGALTDNVQHQAEVEVAVNVVEIPVPRVLQPAQHVVGREKKIMTLRKARSCESLSSLVDNKAYTNKPGGQEVLFRRSDSHVLSQTVTVQNSTVESSKKVVEPSTSAPTQIEKRDPKIWKELVNDAGKSYFILREYIQMAYEAETLQGVVKNIAIGYLTPAKILVKDYKASKGEAADVRKAVRLVLRDVDSVTKIPVCEIVRVGVNSNVENRNKKTPVVVDYGAKAKERIATFSQILKEKKVKELMSIGFKHFRYDHKKRNKQNCENNENNEN